MPPEIRRSSKWRSRKTGEVIKITHTKPDWNRVAVRNVSGEKCPRWISRNAFLSEFEALEVN